MAADRWSLGVSDQALYLSYSHPLLVKMSHVSTWKRELIAIAQKSVGDIAYELKTKLTKHWEKFTRNGSK